MVASRIKLINLVRFTWRVVQFNPTSIRENEVDSALADAIGCELTYETKEVQVCQIQRRPNLVRWFRFGDIL